MRIAHKETKERFIKAALVEMQEHGLSDFSMRRVSARCGTTSGAPYRHFKDRNALILEILKYINERWHEKQKEIISNCDGQPREILVEICMQYIRFQYQNPEYQTILTLNDHSLTPEQKIEKAKLSDITISVIDDYCRSAHVSDEIREKKTYVIRALIYGTALMINTGYIPYNEHTLEYAKSCINREFDLVEKKGEL